MCQTLMAEAGESLLFAKMKTVPQRDDIRHKETRKDR